MTSARLLLLQLNPTEVEAMTNLRLAVMALLLEATAPPLEATVLLLLPPVTTSQVCTTTLPFLTKLLLDLLSPAVTVRAWRKSVRKWRKLKPSTKRSMRRPMMISVKTESAFPEGSLDF